jgi:RNase P/RNase MRP subunit POP5
MFQFQEKNDIKKVISIPIGATGTILKAIRKYLSNIPEKH